MKILVIQLARLGDIYITWPTVRALRRLYPEAQLDLLVRSQFSAAAEGLESIDRLVQLDSRSVLQPLVSEDHLEETVHRVTRVLGGLRREEYDRVINLSFSPLSSYITHFLQQGGAAIRGYTRFEDGFLCLPDAESSYFYAQVGLGRANRCHLAEIFAGLAEVELSEEDWRSPQRQSGRSRLSQYYELDPDLPYLVLHPGASERHKTYDAGKWPNLVAKICAQWPGYVVLIGASSEVEVSERIRLLDRYQRVLVMTGRTHVSDLIDLIGEAEMVVGCDSVPMHIASLTDTPCLNLSFASVNFWETGPRSQGSRILYAQDSESLPTDRVASEVCNLLGALPASRNTIEVTGGIPAYNWPGQEENDPWSLVQAIYLGGQWPHLKTYEDVVGLQRLYEANHLAIEQLDFLSVDGESEQIQLRSGILDRVDEMISVIQRAAPTLAPLIRWYQAEKSSIGPGHWDELVRVTKNVHVMMENMISQMIHAQESFVNAGGQHADR